MKLQSKQQLLEQIEHARSQWEALLAEIGLERMMMPGAMGDWTGKDVVAHLTTWWRREVAGLEAVRRGEQPEPHPSQRDVQVINSWIHYTNRDRLLSEILHEASAVWQQFAANLQALPEPELMQPGRFAWLGEEALGPNALDNFLGHLHEEHEPEIRTWLDRLTSTG